MNVEPFALKVVTFRLYPFLQFNALIHEHRAIKSWSVPKMWRREYLLELLFRRHKFDTSSRFFNLNTRFICAIEQLALVIHIHWSRVHISAPRPSVLTDNLLGFPQYLQTNSVKVTT
jgi:hypothetical protein